VRRLLVAANVVPSSPILVTLVIEALSSSETSALTRATRRNIPEDGIHSHRRENLKSYTALTGWTLYWRRNVSPNKFDRGFYIPEDGTLRSHRRENLKSHLNTARPKGIGNRPMEHGRSAEYCILYVTVQVLLRAG
jgi:hypothetical protein